MSSKLETLLATFTPAQRKALLATLQQPKVAEPTRATRKARARKSTLAASHPVVQIAIAKETVGRCYPTHLNVAVGGTIEGVDAPNGAQCVLASSNKLHWMDRTTGKALLSRKATKAEIKSIRTKYEATKREA